MAAVVYTIVRVVFDDAADFFRLAGHAAPAPADSPIKLRVKLVRTNQAYDAAVFAAQGIATPKGHAMPWILLHDGIANPEVARVRSHEGADVVERCSSGGTEADILYKHTDTHTFKEFVENAVNFTAGIDDAATSSLLVEVTPQSMAADSVNNDHASGGVAALRVVIDSVPDMSGCYSDAMHQPVSGGAPRTLNRTPSGVAEGPEYTVHAPYAPDEQQMYTPFDSNPGWSAALACANPFEGVWTTEFAKVGHSAKNFLVHAQFGPNLKYLEWRQKDAVRPENVWLSTELYHPECVRRARSAESAASMLRCVAYCAN